MAQLARTLSLGSQSMSVSDSDSNTDFPDMDEMQEQIVLVPGRTRRVSVSAESMDPTAQEKFEKVVFPKSELQRTRISKSVSNNFLFKNLDEEQYKDVVDAMVEKTVIPGDWVIRQGQVGDYFYIVETGFLDVYVNRPNLTKSACAQPPMPKPPPDDLNFVAGIKVTDYTAGGSFGELALMYNAPRAASVVATSKCVLWALDRVTFRRILLDHTSKKRRLYESFLDDVKLLGDLEPYERNKIADNLESVVFEDGDIVIKQGDVGDNFYIIEQGQASVTKIDDKGKEYAMKGLSKGDYFGELALLNDAPRLATIRAVGRLKCATLGKKAFTRLLGPLVDIMKRNQSSYEQYPGENKK